MSSNKRTKSRPTLREVAEVAGLSVTQTSRALNGHSDVAVATRRRALDAAERIGYHPNLDARRLKMPDARAQSIGLVLSSPQQRFSDPFLGDLLTSIAQEAANHEFELQLSTPVEHRDILSVYDRAIRSKKVDGFILLRVASDDPRVHYLLDRRFPFVTLGRPRNASGFASVSESALSLNATVEHLVGLGHRSIAAVTLPPGYALAEQRLASFREALASFGMTIVEDALVSAAGYHQDSGFEAAEQLLSLTPRPTAIIAFNDLLSMGVMRAADRRGLSIPRDLSLVAVDDTIVAGHVTPPLTAVRNPAEEYGRRLVTQLLKAINDGPSDSHDTVEAQLIRRKSTAAPPTA